MNIPSLDFDLLKMIGPLRDDISPENPATVCGRCSRPVDPAGGRWVHRHPDRRDFMAGYHVPQIIMKMHFGSKSKWRMLLAKQGGAQMFTPAQFRNEILGESSDDSARLVSKTDLEAAGCLNPNTDVDALAVRRGYADVALGVDWGGGGDKGTSWTAYAVAGLLPTGEVHVFRGVKLPDPNNHADEARRIYRAFHDFQCSQMAHDFTGAGNLRETMMLQAGLNRDGVTPVMYVSGAAQALMGYHASTANSSRTYWTLNKPRSLQLVCQAVKMGKVKLFQYDYKGPEDPGLLHDFLALLENKLPVKGGSDSYQIHCALGQSDDFAHAVNLAVCALWQKHEAWPDFAANVCPQSEALRNQVHNYSVYDDPYGDPYGRY